MVTLRVGLVGTSQLSFFGDKKSVFAKTSGELVSLSKKLHFDLYVYPTTVITPDQARAAVAEFEDRHIDFVLVQCTSFSAGSLAPIFARTKNAFLGLWAIPEFAQDGAVPFNSFCSINMYSGIIGHYLKDFDVRLKWFYGEVGDKLFADRFAVTVRALSTIKKMKNSSVALVGGVAPGFDDLYDDERKILKRFDGLRINRLHEFSEIRDRAVKYSEAEIKPYLDGIVREAVGIDKKAEPLLGVNARFAKAYDEFVAEKGYDGLAISCWPKFQDEFKYSVCSVIAGLNDKGTVAACEGDLTSAISMLMLKYLSEDATTLMDLSAFDPADDTVLMWHCGPTSKRYASRSGYKLGLNYSGMPHVEGSAEPNGCGVTRDMVFAPGEVTIARLTGECDRLFLAQGRFLGEGKKSFHGSRGWMGGLRLNAEDIGALDFVNTILVQRFQHHFPIVWGDYSKEILEIGAWLGMGRVERVAYRDYLQNPLS